MSPTPPGAASATGSTDSEIGPASENGTGRSDDRTEEVPVLGEAPALEESAQVEPPADDVAGDPPHPPPYDQTAVPYDQTATEDAWLTLAGPSSPVDASSDVPEPEPEPVAEADPSGNGAARSSDDTGPLDAPMGPVAPIGPGGTNGFGYGHGYDYGDQPLYADAPVPTGQLTYGDAPGEELAYGDQLAYGGAPVPTDQLTYGEPPAYSGAPAYGEPYAFAQAPVVDAPYGQPPFGEAPVVAPPWSQPVVPAGPVLLPPPTGTPGRGVRSISRTKTKRPQTSKGRRVKRVVRRIELWSVLKVSLLFYFCMYLVALGASAFLWGFAHSAGLIENFESFMSDIGFDDFQFFGDQLFKEIAIVGGVLVVAGSLLTVLAVALVNLISEVTGGVRFVVIEIDADDRPSARQP